MSTMVSCHDKKHMTSLWLSWGIVLEYSTGLKNVRNCQHDHYHNQFGTFLWLVFVADDELQLRRSDGFGGLFSHGLARD